MPMVIDSVLAARIVGRRSRALGAVAVLSAALAADAQVMGSTRSDLARAYMRMDRLYSEHVLASPVPDPARVRDHNLAFDRATLAFFRGGTDSVTAMVDGISARIMEDAGLGARADTLAWSFSADAASMTLVLVPGSQPQPATLAFSLRRVYPADMSGQRTVRASVMPIAGTQAVGPAVAHADVPVTLEVGEGLDVEAAIEVPAETLPGSYGLFVHSFEPTRGPGDESRAALVARVALVDRTMDESRRSMQAKLEEIRSRDIVRDDAWTGAARRFEARLERLTDTPSLSRSDEFLVDMVALRDELTSELETLAQNANPYADRRGTWYRPFGVGGSAVSCWVHVPSAGDGSLPRPVLVALHGASGDEAMFAFSYGGGVARTLADEHGLILVSPRTNRMSVGGALEALLDSLQADYAIDRSRVYVLGHSMGAGVAMLLATRHPELVAGAAMLAGGTMPGDFGGDRGDRAVPMFFAAAELDPLFDIGRFRRAVERVGDAGPGLVTRELSGQGHTLMVGHALPEAVGWLVQQQRR